MCALYTRPNSPSVYYNKLKSNCIDAAQAAYLDQYNPIALNLYFLLTSGCERDPVVFSGQQHLPGFYLLYNYYNHNYAIIIIIIIL